MEKQSRIAQLAADYQQFFGEATNLRFFSAPGRVELCGNHTDHQGGQVVALAIDLDIMGAATKREDQIVRLFSYGADPCTVDLTGDCPQKGTSDSLIWGVATWLKNNGYTVGGFDCVTRSRIPFGSGLSSSAAFENFVATVFDCLYNNNAVSPVEKALAGQWAENTCFGKPCGLMDQLASCLGNVSFMDFSDSANPQAQTVAMPLASIDRVLCVVKTGGSHADLTYHYAAIPAEMKSVAAFFGKEVLSQITKKQMMDNLPALRNAVGDRAVLRSLNYFDECERSRKVLAALKEGETKAILHLLSQSGMGSQTLLQNVSNPEDTAFDGVGMALYVSRQICPEGTYRVHGGGFGGTMLGLVPTKDFARYQQEIQAVFGEGSCIALQVRPEGGVEIF
ncbi:MAG: galactokinase [Clostridia bacterium]|nr:galactokinase [Clostridia bacterium]